MRTKLCGECGILHTLCDKCGKQRSTDVKAGHTWTQVPPPYGSLSASTPMLLCGECNRALARLVFEWVGEPVPPLLLDVAE